jgi:hypothetical protein
MARLGAIVERLRLRDERGFTFVELLVGAMIGLIVIGASMGLLAAAVKSEPRISERAGQIQQGRFTLERLTRELRQGTAVTGATASGLQIVTWVDSAGCGSGTSGSARLCRVIYTCGSTTCTRTERNPDGSGSAAPRTVIEGISGPSIFCYAPSTSTCSATSATNPSYVGVTLTYPDAGGEETVTLADGVSLRNWLEDA